jgi:DNA recombination protein RmuC
VTDPLYITAAALVGVLAGVVIMSLFNRRLGQDLERSEQHIANLKSEKMEQHAAFEQMKAASHGHELALVRAQSREEEQAARRAFVEKDVQTLRQEVTRLTGENRSLQTALEKQAQADAEKLAELKAHSEKIEESLKKFSEQALLANQGSFLKLANEVLDKHYKTAVGDLDKRQEAIKNLLKPISVTLEDYQKNLKGIEKARAEAYGNLSNELKTVIETQGAVRAETSKLVNALRAAPKTRGRWGEETLKRVMELSGMSPHCDFVTEKSFTHEDSKLRPDVVIHLPGERSIVVDAKTSTSAYLDAIESHDEAERETHLVNHARQLRQHMKQLGDKSYQHGLKEAPDFVVMFVPGENFVAAAMEKDPRLFEDSIANGVLITTPTTLIALVKAIAYGWRQEKLNDNAKEIAKLGKELYGRLATMCGHLDKVGYGLQNAVSNYNAFVGSLESRVLPSARRFRDLEVEDSGQEVPDVRPVDLAPRQIQSEPENVLLEPSTNSREEEFLGEA